MLYEKICDTVKGKCKHNEYFFIQNMNKNLSIQTQ